MSSRANHPPLLAIASAFEEEVERLLRLRFTWLISLWLGLIGLQYALAGAVYLAVRSMEGVEAAPFAMLREPILLGVLALRLATLVAALVLVRKAVKTGRGVVRTAYWVLILSGLWSIGGAIGEEIHHLNTEGWRLGAMAPVILVIALSHFFACALLPWTPRQGVQPLLVLYPAWLITTALVEPLGVMHLVTGALVAPSIISVGLLLCWWRISRLRNEVEVNQLRRQFSRSRRDLIDARKIHERRFPRPLEQGPIRLAYAYEPMRQVGGDFLHVHAAPDGALSVVLIDVTGHGIPAALTVNRVDGEVQRLYAEQPDASPAEVVARLNRYFHLVMARHSIFATAVLCRIHLDGRMEWVNAGHPPAFIRRRDGSLEALESTAFMLGAAPDEAFDPGMQAASLEVDDLVILYTDGAIEAVDERGRQFGVRGVEQVVARWRPDFPVQLAQFLPQAVSEYRHGATQDDVLITTVSRAAG